MKRLFKATLRKMGLEITRIAKQSDSGGSTPIAGGIERPIANTRMFLEDIHARGFNPRGIIDVGANRGDWSRMAMSVFPSARMLMIEPQREMIPFLEEVCSSFESVEYVRAGAGREPGELVQTIWADLAGSSFLPEVHDDNLANGTQRKTPIVTIDKLLSERGSFVPDLIKLDIQGFELEALKGATSTFGIAEVFILETSLYHFMKDMPTTVDCIRFMADRGYELYDVTDFLRRPLDGALGQVDLAFALREGSLRSSDRWSA
jgi:FkbM family methyltransferase